MHRQANSKRKRPESGQAAKSGGRRENKLQWQDEEISSSEDDHEGREAPESGDDSEDFEESAESKRLRLAKQYLNQMKAGDNDEGSGSDSGTDDDAHVSNKLKTTRLRAKGELFEDFSQRFARLDIDACSRRDLSGHQSSVTCVAVTKDETSVISCSKDNSVVKWDIESGSKVELRPKWNSSLDYQSSKGEMLAVAVSHDSRYVASGGRDGSIRIYDSRQKYAEVKELKGHRGAVTSLCFRMDSYTLFSGSLDRCLKHWDINDMAYIETMFGHQVGAV
jgi:ribosomal RNA-processing protein 9